MFHPTDPWRLIWRYPVCKHRKLKERVCCHGLKQRIQYCTLLKYRVFNECVNCDQRGENNEERLNGTKR